MSDETESKYQLWVAYIDLPKRRREPYIMLRESREGAMNAAERQLEWHDVEPTEWDVLGMTGGEGRAMRPGGDVIVDVEQKWVREELMVEGDGVEEYESVCPSCGEESIFAEEGGFGLLTCQSCGYAPPRKTRQKIRGEDDE